MYELLNFSFKLKKHLYNLQVTNMFGIEWMKRHLGKDYSIHVVDFCGPYTFHIDTSLILLKPGLALIHPEGSLHFNYAEFFEKAGWKVSHLLHMELKNDFFGTGLQCCTQSCIHIAGLAFSLSYSLACSLDCSLLLTALHPVLLTIVSLAFSVASVSLSRQFCTNLGGNSNTFRPCPVMLAFFNRCINTNRCI